MPSDPLLTKAERYVRSAKLLVQHGDLDSAASRLYYAMFYIAEALLPRAACRSPVIPRSSLRTGSISPGHACWTLASTGLC
jgi:hypothetical protein